MKLTPIQQYLILGVILVCGLVFAYYQFLLKPKMAEIEKLRSTLEEKKKDLEDAKKIVAKYAEFKKRADTVQRELEWVQNRIPKTIDKSKLVEAIGLIQNRSGVYLTNFNMNTGPSSRDVFVELPAIVRISTNFDGLLRFLKEISLNSGFLMIAKDLSVTPLGSTDDPKITISAQMTVCGVQAK
ncbi:MAG TPA: type 4a pilus biogenesis protein PilO [bacterium]|nr:type 4a pilus biogenesis protein PilO [bacterium]